MEFLFQQFLVISSVLLGCVASYNDTLCEKLRSCVTADMMKVVQDRTKLCALMPDYLACTDKYKKHCTPERAQRLAVGMKFLEDKAATCSESLTPSHSNSDQCAPAFSECLTPEFKALKGKDGQEEELCRLAPEIIGCMDNAIDEHCSDKAAKELEIMAAEFKKWRANLRCNAGCRLAYGIGQLGVGVLILLMHWLHR